MVTPPTDGLLPQLMTADHWRLGCKPRALPPAARVESQSPLTWSTPNLRCVTLLVEALQIQNPDWRMGNTAPNTDSIP